MDITFDPAKNTQNIVKHGLDFTDVQFLDWDNAMFKEDDRQDYNETRIQAFVRGFDGQAYVVVFTPREALHIISFRRAHEKERKKFDV